MRYGLVVMQLLAVVMFASVTYAGEDAGEKIPEIAVPADWTEETLLKALAADLREEARNNLHGFTLSLKGSMLTLDWRLHEREVKQPRSKIGNEYRIVKKPVPIPDGLRLTLSIVERYDGAAERPQSTTYPSDAGPLHILLGKPYSVPGMNAQIVFNLEYGTETDKDLVKVFSAPDKWIRGAVLLCDWPHRDPLVPPTKKKFENMSPETLMPYVLGNKVIEDDPDLEGRDGCRLACAWFVWKTKDAEDGKQLRNSLSKAILEHLQEIQHSQKRSLHDASHLVQYLGVLNAKVELDTMMHTTVETEPAFSECCYFPALIRSFAEAYGMESVPRLANAAAKESESNAGVVNDALRKLTGHNPPLKNGRTDGAAWAKWWQDRQRDKP